MTDAIRVNLHCHSIFSDGDLSPEALADNLAASDVRYAALTDHDSVEGLPRFQEALRRRGIGHIPGVELTAQWHGREAHILGYGFDPAHPELKATLLSLRQARAPATQSIAESMRQAGTSAGDRQAANAAPNGRLDAGEAIALLHRAGGRAFLAHPLFFEPDWAALEAELAALKSSGLDGVEAIYEAFTPAQRERLSDAAARCGLLVCAGTDVHAAGAAARPAAYRIDMPAPAWRRLRDAVFSGPAFTRPAEQDAAPPAAPARPPARAVWITHAVRRRSFVLRILLPALLAIALFVAAIWGYIIPSFENALLERKREMIRELTNSAWSVLASYERDERAGRLTRSEAQAMARERVGALRYGRDGKDYFWLQDMTPRIVMHPYRPDLNDQDVSDFADPRGVHIFVEFADLVRRQGEGYIEYVWQWNDDPQRLAPKESYVKGFEPWGWIIGTGLYIDDVKQEIARLEQTLIVVALLISSAVIALLLFVVQQSLRIDHERRDVENSLRESTERYRSLVEATTEGALLVIDGRCRYANPTLLQMLGFGARQVELLELADVLPRDPANEAAWSRIERPAADAGGSGGLEGVLRCSSGQLIECVLVLNPISFEGSAGFILLAKDVAPDGAAGANGAAPSRQIAQVAQAAPLGLFRARASRRGVFVDMNAAARSLLDQGSPGRAQPGLADLFDDPAAFDAFVEHLQQHGEVRDCILQLKTIDARTRVLSLSANLQRDEHGHPACIDGVLADITEAQKRDVERDALLERLQTSLSFLHEPISRLSRDVARCGLETTISRLAAIMATSHTSAVLVETGDGAAVGIVTDHDLRERVLAQKLDPRAPARVVMSAPLVAISEHALVYEALMRMEDKGIQHLAIVDEDGRVVGMVSNKELIQFQRYGTAVITRDIARAAAPEDVARSCRRAPEVVQALVDSGARPRTITRILAAICDAAVERFIALATAELGPPPAPFVFMAMGSHGRQEQTLVTDQDNAILFAAAEQPGEQAAASQYFQELGRKVCAWLDLAGYPACRGQFMASNPRWCKTLPEWKQYFSGWIARAEPQELLEFSIFFDFRAVYGDVALAGELRRHVHAELEGQPAFFPHLARNALRFTPPVRLFGNIYLGGRSTDHGGQLDLKEAMLPIVDFARLYALRQGVDHTHTLDRIETLVEQSVLLPASRDDTAAAYDFLMRLRLQHQAAAIRAGEPAGNLVNPRRIHHTDEALLRQAFSQITALQKKISYDFMGGTAADAG